MPFWSLAGSREALLPGHPGSLLWPRVPAKLGPGRGRVRSSRGFASLIGGASEAHLEASGAGFSILGVLLATQERDCESWRVLGTAMVCLQQSPLHFLHPPLPFPSTLWALAPVSPSLFGSNCQCCWRSFPELKATSVPRRRPLRVRFLSLEPDPSCQAISSVDRKPGLASCRHTQT